MSSRKDRKRPEPPQEEGSPAWMNTYGDMVTLLLTFFVLLFSFSVIDAKKFEEIANSFAGTPFVAVEAVNAEIEEISILNLHGPGDTSEELKESAQAIQKEFDQLYQAMKTHIERNQLDTELTLQKEDDVILLRVRESALFDSGKADIKQESLPLLEQVAEVFDKHGEAIEMITIEGHTDNVPISSARFRDNWELSTSRATRVLRYFFEHSSLEQGQYSVRGFGELQPVASNDTEEGKALNRRVDFVIQGYKFDE